MALLSKSSVRRHFNRAAADYAKAAFLQQEVLQRLFARLDYLKIVPQRILDCGARTGASSELLRKRYPKATVISYDLSEGLLKGYRRRWYQSPALRVAGDYEALPFQERKFDLVFSNLALHWTNDYETMLSECFRVLKPHGILLFTTVGPDTFKELRACVTSQVRAPHLHRFMDMHDIGDLLIKRRFIDPVMDMEYLQMRYGSVKQFLLDLKATGVNNARLDRTKGLLARSYWRNIEEEYHSRWQLVDGSIPATIEVIYGHAWLPERPELSGVNQQGEVHVPISILKKR